MCKEYFNILVVDTYLGTIIRMCMPYRANRAHHDYTTVYGVLCIVHITWHCMGGNLDIA
jgi:hypothetical protein